MRRRLVLLGSTGSIGRSTLEVVDHLGDVQVVGLAARQDADGLAVQAARYRPRAVAIEDREAVGRLRGMVPPGTAVLGGPEGIAELAGHPESDLVLVAVVGIAGLLPTLAALRAGKDVALANKETLVAGGGLVMAEVRRSGRTLLPVDGEHSAIFQCLQGAPAALRRVVLTASGGPFLRRPLGTLAAATPEEALSHPTWHMGKKITVDSATLMNKGFEVIEAHWLFGVTADQVQVVIHPQSLVHSLVEFVDGSLLAQVAPPDMRLFIQFALTYPDRRPSLLRPISWEDLTMTFELPEPDRYPCLGLAYQALRAGGTAPAVLNAADEVAVGMFLERRIAFGEIPLILRRTMEAHRPVANPTLEDVLAADAWARETASRHAVEVS